MVVEDYIDWDDVPDYYYDQVDDDSTVDCKFCGAECEWGLHQHKWRLFDEDTDELHVCKTGPRRQTGLLTRILNED